MAVISGITSLIAGGQQKKAINKATDASTAATRDSIAYLERNNERIDEKLSPFYNNGIAATNQINALLGLPQLEKSAPRQQTAQNFSRPFGYGQDYGFGSGFGSFQQQQQSAPQSSAPSQTTQQAAEDAFDVFRNSTGYQFRVGEGQDALATRFGSRGIGQSGAALKEMEKYRQNVASSEFGNYLGALQGQQNIGFGAASTSAGVTQNLGNNITGLQQQNAANIGNAAIAKGNVSANTINTIGGGIGGALGFLTGGSSFGF